MPPGFAFPHSAGMPGSFTLPRRTLLWVPLALSRGGRVRGEPSELAVVGRLAPGFTRDGAQAELDLFANRMEREFPQGKGWFNSRVTPMTRQLAGETRRPLLLLLRCRRRRAADRLLERGEPAAHAIDRAHPRIHGTSRPRRGTHPPDPSADDREPAARDRRRSWRPCSRLRWGRLRESLRSVQRSAAGGSAHRSIGAVVRDRGLARFGHPVRACAGVGCRARPARLVPERRRPSRRTRRPRIAAAERAAGDPRWRWRSC